MHRLLVDWCVSFGEIYNICKSFRVLVVVYNDILNTFKFLPLHAEVMLMLCKKIKEFPDKEQYFFLR